LKKQISIDVFSDTICPWCYIGYTKLNESLIDLKNLNFDIIWRPFQLNPDMPLEGIDRELYLTSKFGNKEDADLIYKRIEDEGKLNNIFFQFNNIKKTPNSFFSHKLLAYAHRKRKQTQVLETLFYQYFIEGSDIGDLQTLIQIAKDTKIYDKNIKNYIISNKDNENLLNEEKQAREIGVNGVPCFIFNKELVVNGAQPKEKFVQIINSLNNYV
jgi:predicted DsbA family dithiol-disulfide isomerase